MAREGVTGAPEILEDRRGFFRRFSYRPLLGMLGELERFRVMETLTIKTYPGCHYFQTAYEAIEQIRARRPDAAIDSVLVETTKLATEATRFAREYVAPDDLTSVNANFDLGLSAAILLHAGRLTTRELEESWLAANAAPVEALRARISVVHSPALTAKVIATASHVPAARREIRTLRAGELFGLRRHYRDDYASELASPREIVALVAASLRELRAGAPHDGVRMWFPSRVTIEFAGGAREVVQVDLPRGSFVGGDIDAAIAEKLARELGDAAAQRALEVGRTAENHAIATLVDAFTVTAS